MGQNMKAKGSHLELHRGVYRAVLRVPQDLIGVLGKERLKKSLGTTSLTQAEKAKHRVIADWLTMFEAARKSPGDALQRLSDDSRGIPTAELLRAAREARKAVEDHPDRGEPYGDISYEILDSYTAMLKREGAREDQLETAWQVATGQETLDTLLERWRAETRTKAASKDAVSLELRRLPSGFSVKASKRDAARHVSDMLQAGVNRVTIRVRVRRLSAFWSWLEQRGEVDINPWRGQAPEVREEDKSGGRPWTEAEARAFIDATPEGHHLHVPVRLAMFAGLRIGEIVALSFEGGDWINVAKGKTANAPRDIPRHHVINAKALKDFCSRRRSRKTIDGQFRAVRGPLIETEVVEGRLEGQTKGVVVFHGGRKWFSRRLVLGLERPACGYSQVTVDRLMGHASKNLAIDVYAKQAVSEGALKAAVEGILRPPPQKAQTLQIQA